MAWNRGQLSAEEILGMKPDELKSKLDSSASKDDLTAATTKIDEMGTTLSAIQASLAKLTTPPPTVDPNATADLEDPTTQILTDPQGYIARATAGTQTVALETKAQLNEMRARTKYAGAFAKYNDELTTKANAYSLQQRAQDSFWDYHVATVTGQKVLSGELEGGYPSLVGSGSFSSGVTQPEDKNHGFDPEVAAFLKSRGVPLDKAAIISGKMKDGETLGADTYARPN